MHSYSFQQQLSKPTACFFEESQNYQHSRCQKSFSNHLRGRIWFTLFLSLNFINETTYELKMLIIIMEHLPYDIIMIKKCLERGELPKDYLSRKGRAKECYLPWRAAFLTTKHGKIAFWNISFDRFPPCHQTKLWSGQPSAVTSEAADCFLLRLPLSPRFCVVATVHVAFWAIEESTNEQSTSLTQSPEKAMMLMCSSSCK